MKIVSSFGKRIKEYREDNKLTLAEMERLTNVPAQTINRYELEQRVPKVDAAILIAEKLNLNPLWLFGYDAEKVLVSHSSFDFNEHEFNIIKAYRSQPETQPFVDKLLGVQVELAARGGKYKVKKKDVLDLAERMNSEPYEKDEDLC